VPIALGHAIAIGVIVPFADLVQIALPLKYVRAIVAAMLIGLGVSRVLHSRHFRFGGMRVGFGRLTMWSILMASAHGAGLMVLPVLIPMPPEHHHPAGVNGFEATLVHTAGYLIVTATVALVVYQKLRLALLRTAWLNLDLVWALALIVTGCVAMFASARDWIGILHGIPVIWLVVPIFHLARFDRDGKSILGRRQRAGGVR